MPGVIRVNIWPQRIKPLFGNGYIFVIESIIPCHKNKSIYTNFEIGLKFDKITSAKIRRVVGWTNRPAPTDDSYLWYNSSS